MIGWAELTPFLALGLLGSLHCAGMCGGFALAAAGGPQTPPRRMAARQSLYVVGKATSYAVLGAMVALGGTWVRARGVDGGAFLALQTVLGVVAGGLLVLMGLGQLGVRPGWTRALAERPSRVLGGARRLLAGIRSLPGAAGIFGTGVANGLIPCGLSWGAVLLASQYEPGPAALGAFLFGLSTAPALTAVVAASRLARHALRGRARTALGLTLVVFGSAAVVRALPAGSASEVDAGTVERGCCEVPAELSGTAEPLGRPAEPAAAPSH